jgi:hypothetical protein
MTSYLQVDKAQRIINLIEKDIIDTGVLVRTYLDDWSDSGSFRAFITISSSKAVGGSYHLPEEINLRTIGNIIKRHTKNQGTYIQSIVMPKRSYYTVNYKKYFEGYNDNRIQFDFIVNE